MDDVIPYHQCMIIIMVSLGLYSNVWLRLIMIRTQVVEGLTIFWVQSLAKTCPDTKFHVYCY